MIKLDDILCSDDIDFFKLEHKGHFADSKIYTTEKFGYLLDEIKEHKEEPLYRVRFAYELPTKYDTKTKPEYKSNEVN